MPAVRTVGYAVLGFFVGFLATFAIENFAQSAVDTTLAADGYTLIYHGPWWAVFWESLPNFIGSWALPIVGAAVGVMIAKLFPHSLRE